MNTHTVWRITDARARPGDVTITEHRILPAGEPVELDAWEEAEPTLEFRCHGDELDDLCALVLYALDFHSWEIARLVVHPASTTPEWMRWDSPGSITSSVRVEFTPAHAHVRAWNRGGYAGEITVLRDDWPHFVRAFGFDPETPTKVKVQP